MKAIRKNEGFYLNRKPLITTCTNCQDRRTGETKDFAPAENTRLEATWGVLQILRKTFEDGIHKRPNIAVTKYLAKFIVETKYNDIPEKVKEHAKLCVLDWLGAVLAGTREHPANIVTSTINAMREKQESTIIGTKTKASCMSAALVNGVCGHIIELDDIHQESLVHPAASVIPAALAISERDNVSGKDLITSIVVGYEVEIRIGLALNPSHYRFWHPTSTCGAFGAAAAAGKILSLDKKSTVHSLGIAGTQAAGLIEVFGTMSKSLNPGKAAQNGILAALLAQKGFTSSSMILEAEKGYCHATAEKTDFNRITKNLGAEFKLTENIFKIHASCGHTHGPIDAMLLIVKEHDIRPEDVDEIIVGTYPIALEIVGKNYAPKTAFEARFSLPYCLASALVCGKVGLTEFSAERLRDPQILKLSKKIKMRVDSEYMHTRLGGAKVTVRTIGGREIAAALDAPKGYPRNPLTKVELKEKFAGLASLVLPPKTIADITQSLDYLEKIHKMKQFTALLRS